MHRTPVALLAALVLFAPGCSDDTKTPTTGSTSGSTTGSTSGTTTGSSSGGEATSGGSTSGNAGGLNLTPVACYKAGSKKCDIHGESDQAHVDAEKTSCTDGGGTVVDRCPADGLQGCCLSGGRIGSCTYDAANAATLQGACGIGGTAWQTTAP